MSYSDRLTNLNKAAAENRHNFKMFRSISNRMSNILSEVEQTYDNNSDFAGTGEQTTVMVA